MLIYDMIMYFVTFFYNLRIVAIKLSMVGKYKGKDNNHDAKFAPNILQICPLTENYCK